MKRAFCILACILVVAPLSGCWSRKEPKTLTVVNSAIYDITENGMYEVTIEMINPSARGGANESAGGKSPHATAKSEGISLPEALRNVSESVEKRLFGGHNKVRFFTERFARTKMVSSMDYLLRDRLLDENPLMIVVRTENPEDIYTCVLGLSDMVGDYFEELSRSQPALTSKAVFVDTLNFVKDYYNHGKQPVIGVVELAECESKPSKNTPVGPDALEESSNAPEIKYEMRYEGLAAFKDGYFVGYMDGVEARAYNFLVDEIENAIFSLPSGDGFNVLVVHGAKTDIKTAFEGEIPKIDVKIKAALAVIQTSGESDIMKAEPLKILEAQFNEKLKQEIAAAIKKAQTEFASDIFGFGNAVHREHPEKWKEICEYWDDCFVKAAFAVSVESSIDRTGEIKRPFTMEG